MTLGQFNEICANLFKTNLGKRTGQSLFKFDSAWKARDSSRQHFLHVLRFLKYSKYT